jgi:hypothetical protein
MTKAAKKNAKRKDKKPSEQDSVDAATQSLNILRYVECSICHHCLQTNNPKQACLPQQHRLMLDLVCSVSDAADTSDRPPGLGGDKQQSAETGVASSKANGSSNSDSASTHAAASSAVTTATDVLQNAGAAAPTVSQDTEKQLRNLRKKIRQADATAQKAAEGIKLTLEEQEKLQKLKGW